MKLFLKSALVITTLSLPVLQASTEFTDENQQKSPKISIFQKISEEYKDVLLSEKVYYEDCLEHFCKTKERLSKLYKEKNNEEEILKILSIEFKFEVNDLETFKSYINNRIISSRNILENKDISLKFLNNLSLSKENNKKKIIELFNHIFSQYKEYLEGRLNNFFKRQIENENIKKWYTFKESGQEITTENLEKNGINFFLIQGASALYYPPSSQEYRDKEKKYPNIEISLTKVHEYQMLIKFMAKLYPSVCGQLKDTKTLAYLMGNKGLMDILQKKTKDLGHVDQGLETYPTSGDVSHIMNYWKKKNIKKFTPPLVYQKRTWKLEKLKNDIEIFFLKDHERTPAFNWSQVTLSNIDLLREQVDYFFKQKGKKLDYKKIEEIIEKKKIELIKEKENQNKLMEKNQIIENATIEKKETLETPIEEKNINEQASINEKEVPFTQGKEKITTIEKIEHNIIESKNNTNSQGSGAPKNLKNIPKEKNREERKKLWELEKEKEKRRMEQKNNQNKEKENEVTENNTNDFLQKNTPVQLHKDTLIALDIIFDKGVFKQLKWDVFVNAWSNLRKVIDGVEDVIPLPNWGSSYKFHGGPIMENSKKGKARSFSIHWPHTTNGDYTLKHKAIARIAEKFQDTFGWTLETLEKHGFNSQN